MFRIAWLLLFLLSPSLQAAERHAFVLGNSAYQGKARLTNPQNDAADVALELSRLGYKLHSGGALLDLDLESFRDQFAQFLDQLPADAVALFYYAGHGISDGRENFLIPVRSGIKREQELPELAISLSAVINSMASRGDKALNIFLLDACRDNPLQTPSNRKGLIRVIEDLPSRGIFIGYAASEGEVAGDGTGQRNGVYTGELLKALRQRAGDTLEDFHKSVATSVLRNTRDKQFPVSHSRLVGDVCISECSDFNGDLVVGDEISSQAMLEQSRKLESENKTPRWVLGIGAVIALGLVLSSQGSGDSGDSGGNVGFPFEIEPP